MGINIRTSNFDVFNKFSNLKIKNTITFDNTPMNRRHLAKIINNINNSYNYIDAILSDKKIIIRKRQPFHFNVYLTRR